MLRDLCGIVTRRADQIDNTRRGAGSSENVEYQTMGVGAKLRRFQYNCTASTEGCRKSACAQIKGSVLPRMHKRLVSSLERLDRYSRRDYKNRTNRLLVNECHGVRFVIRRDN